MSAPDQMGATPRTDAEGTWWDCATEVIEADFARQLERENAALVAAASEALDWMVKAGYDDGVSGHMLRAALALARQA